MPTPERKLHRHAMIPVERVQPVRHRKTEPSVGRVVISALHRLVTYPRHRAKETPSSHV